MNLEKATKLARQNMKEKLKSGENILGWSQEEFAVRMTLYATTSIPPPSGIDWSAFMTRLFITWPV